MVHQTPSFRGVFLYRNGLPEWTLCCGFVYALNIFYLHKMYFCSHMNSLHKKFHCSIAKLTSQSGKGSSVVGYGVGPLLNC